MIIVFGSNVLDIFFHMADLPPKDTAVHMDCHDEAPGGKGANQAVAAARAGAKVKFFGALGEGGHGRQMYKNLAKCGIDVSGIQFLDMPSGLAAIFIDETDGTHKIVVSQGANKMANAGSISDADLDEKTTILVQGELAISETEKLLERAKARGGRTVMNYAPATQPLSENLLNNLDIIILNEHEADSLGKALRMQTSDKPAFANDLFKRFNLTTIITLGGIGSIVCCPEGTLMVSPLKITPVDTVGAGDAYTGYLCAALDQGQSFRQALKWASVAGSVACTKIGAQTALPFIDEVSGHLEDIKISVLRSDNIAA